MLTAKNKDISKAYDKLKVMSKDEKSRMAYEAREAEIHDQMTRIKTAREEGINEGIQKGIQQGAINIAKNLLVMGMELEVISKATGLSIEEIKSLKN